MKLVTYANSTNPPSAKPALKIIGTVVEIMWKNLIFEWLKFKYKNFWARCKKSKNRWF
jgi:hypothetical protein